MRGVRGARGRRLCAACGRTRMKALRAGVSRVREELEALVGEAVGEVSGPRTRPVPDTRYLVGTEAVLHRVRSRPRWSPSWTSTCICSRPGCRRGRSRSASSPGPAGLVGGRGQPGAGAVVVQTRMPDHEVLTAAAGRAIRVRSSTASWRCARSSPCRRSAPLPSCPGPGAAELAAALGLEGSALGDGRWLVRAADHVTLCDRLAATARPTGAVKVVVDPVGV